MTGPPIILTIDRNTRNLEQLQRFLCDNGFHVLTASTLEEVELRLRDAEAIRLAMVDIAGFDSGIWEHCEHMRDLGIPFLVISPQQRIAYLEKGIRYGARGTLTRPLAQRELLALLRTLLGESARPRRNNR